MGGAETDSSRYRLSFGTGGLFLGSAPIAAELYLAEGDWGAVRAQLDAENLLQTRTASSARRMGRELVDRLSHLDLAELRMVVDGTSTERGHLLWIAACRHYALIREFAEEVVRERFLLMRETLSYADFDSFLAGKELWHPELAELTPSTIAKLRQSLFRMMREAGFVSKDGVVTRVLLSPRVDDELLRHAPNDLRFFPNLKVEGWGG